MMASVPSIGSREDLVAVWLHEQARVFRDRLIDETDRVWFNNLSSEMLTSRLGKHLRYQPFLLSIPPSDDTRTPL